MKTLNIILKQFEDIANAHKQVNSFGIGDSWEIGASGAGIMAQLWINPTGAFMENANGTVSSTVYSINMKCFDLVNKDEDNENEVLSDTLQILQDIVAEFNTSPDIIDLDIVLNASLSFTPFTEKYDQEVSGWETTIELMQPFNSCYNDKPIER